MEEDSQLISLFVKCYRDFEANMKIATASKKTYMVFGVTGAGKSTFISRLKDKGESSQFFNKVIQPTAEYKGLTHEGIQIGDKVGSTTIVPKQHSIASDISIFDVPGFDEVDIDLKEIIYVLHRCILKQVSVNMYIVVIPAAYLFENTMNTIRTKYYDRLCNFFTEERLINVSKYNILFVVNQVDLVDKDTSPKAIKSVVTELAMHYLDIDGMEKFSRFLRNMANNLLVVDYSTFDLSDFTAHATSLESNVSRKPLDSVPKVVLDIQEGAIVRRLEEFSRKKTEAAKDLLFGFRKEVARLAEQKKIFREKQISTTNKLSQTKQQLNEQTETVGRITDEVVGLEANVSMSERRIIMLQTRIEEAKKYTSDALLYMTGIGVVSTSTMCPFRRAGKMGWSDYFQYSGGTSTKNKCNFIVTTKPTITNFDSVEESKRFGGPEVLVNNHSVKSSSEIKYTMFPRDDYTYIHAESKHKFWLHFITEKELDPNVEKQLHKKINEAKGDTETQLEEEAFSVKSMRAKAADLNFKKEEITMSSRELTENVAGLTTVLSETDTKIAKVAAEWNNYFEQVRSEFKEFCADSTIDLCDEAFGIFQANDLKTGDFETVYQVLQQYLEELVQMKVDAEPQELQTNVL